MNCLPRTLIVVSMSVLLLLFAGPISGCKSNGAKSTYQMDSSGDQFSKVRPRDPDSESTGLSSRSREIERHLGVGGD